MPLVNGHYLFLYNLIGLGRKERYATTLACRYVYQRAVEENEASWIFRYEYEREPAEGYPYPLAHLHVNASPDTYDAAKAFSDLHLPVGARGITIEQLVRHLIAEHGLAPISPGWESTLEGAQKFFDEIQRKRVTS